MDYSGGKIAKVKNDTMFEALANTFKALAGLADWSAPLNPTLSPSAEIKASASPTVHPDPSIDHSSRGKSDKPFPLHYDIHIHLPESRDPAVFDAIFEAMRKHLSA